MTPRKILALRLTTRSTTATLRPCFPSAAVGPLLKQVVSCVQAANLATSSLFFYGVKTSIP
jgi:hypothetical protein